jgi:hypothetical protein
VDAVVQNGGFSDQAASDTSQNRMVLTMALFNS